MSSKSETLTSKMDTAKLLVAIALVVVAVVAFYYFESTSQLARVAGLLVVVGVAVAMAATTTFGSGLIEFMQDSRSELRKVVWPSRQETLQVSLAVILMVIVMSIFLWLLDMFLFWLVRLLTG
ncbi:MAG: preprotein translocase subunit SecE [Gammaproteobacteria bacterium]